MFHMLQVAIAMVQCLLKGVSFKSEIVTIGGSTPETNKPWCTNLGLTSTELNHQMANFDSESNITKSTMTNLAHIDTAIAGNEIGGPAVRSM